MVLIFLLPTVKSLRFSSASLTPPSIEIEQNVTYDFFYFFLFYSFHSSKIFNNSRECLPQILNPYRDLVNK
uniref:Putative secreted protein n=1 Tax=Xenopsylla cheopis TaxID=163159 RepID=A0A6M2DYM6_XENCH